MATFLGDEDAMGIDLWVENRMEVSFLGNVHPPPIALRKAEPESTATGELPVSRHEHGIILTSDHLIPIIVIAVLGGDPKEIGNHRLVNKPVAPGPKAGIGKRLAPIRERRHATSFVSVCGV